MPRRTEILLAAVTAVSYCSASVLSEKANCPAATIIHRRSEGPTRGDRDALSHRIRLEQQFDPVLEYSSYLGGSGADEANNIAVDSEGFVYITGVTASSDFPGSVGAARDSLQDIFVTKIDIENNRVVYSTIIAGHGNDSALDIVVDGNGNAYLTGFTTSIDFPTTPGAFQSEPRSGAGSTDAFVVKLDSAGAIQYSTLLGGATGHERANALAIDQSGRVTVAGKTTSADFPLTGAALQRGLIGFEDGFISRLNSTGSDLIFSTYFGGRGNTDEIFDVADDHNGSIYVTGHTSSDDLPVTIGAVQNSFGGGNEFAGDAFAAKLDISSSQLVYLTYLGGRAGDVGRAIAVDSRGNAYMTGTTTSIDFPVTNAIQAVKSGECVDIFSNCTEAFAIELNQAGTALVYSTYLGGGIRGSSPFQAGESGISIAVDSAGNAYVAGMTGSVDFPSFRAIQRSIGGAGDAFLVRLGERGRQLVYATYLGGAGDEGAAAVALDSRGRIYLAGTATSPGFPVTPNALQVNFAGSHEIASAARDGFFLRIAGVAPVITSASVRGRKLFVSGRDFDFGAVVLLDGQPQKTRNDETDSASLLIAKKAGKKIPVNSTAVLTVRNADGTSSPEFQFRRVE